jgi:CubicO group peptidase (beta-lactamase class C family)
VNGFRCACLFGIVAWLGKAQAASLEGDYFPPPESRGGWRKLEQNGETRRLAGVAPEKLAELKQWLLDSDHRNFAAVVIRRGYIVLEVERGNSAKTDARRVASVSKAICATVLAIASEQSQRGLTPKKMKFDDRAFDFIPWAKPLSDNRKESITVKQLLNHTSGICPEATGAPNDGTWEYILGHTGDRRTAKLAFDPGTGCGYSTHALHHAALVCETVSGMPYDQFAIKALFEPLGIEHWWFQYFDDTKIGRHPSHGMGMPARDLARIGYCMLRDGRWNDQQVIPKWFVNETAAPTHDVKTPEMRWKLNPQVFSHGWELPARHSGESGRSGAGIPADARAKPGSGGQLIALVPSLDLVVTRQTGSSGEWQFEEYVRRACEAALPGTSSAPSRAIGPLRVHPTNARYFTDGTTLANGSLKAVYLTGSHTWANLIDRGPKDPPPVFDFDRYLDFLEKYHHNFIRLWARHVSWYHDYGKGELHATPLAWPRTGSGKALDGKPKFDLSKFNQAYFERLRARVIAARDRGIYVSIMLFGGSYECRGGWRGNPFNAQNNINGIDGDPEHDGAGLETQTLQVPAITRLQEAYVRKVIDTINDLDNVLYEISNESDDLSKEWQYHLIRYIHDYEARKPKQHPTGMTPLWSGPASFPALLASPAEWISPQVDAAAVRKIPASHGIKVSILDSDHWFVRELRDDPVFGRGWVWKSFCRGHNPILMEHLPPLSAVLDDLPFAPDDPGYIASRKAMGFTRQFAERIDLAAMTPQREISSTHYCLANSGKEYLVYQPAAGEPFSIRLNPGAYGFEWFNPQHGATTKTGMFTTSGGEERFHAPFDSDAVLYVKSTNVQ